MKQTNLPSFSTQPPTFDFPARPDSDTSANSFKAPCFLTEPEKEPSFSNFGFEAPCTSENPFFLAADESETPEASPFGIPLSSLKPMTTSRRKLSLRLLSFAIKGSFVCLLAMVGWFGYGEYVSGAGNKSGAEFRSILSTWFLSEETIKDTPEPEPKTFVAEAMIPAHKIPITSTSKIEKATEIPMVEALLDPKPTQRRDDKTILEEEMPLREKLEKNAMNPELILSLASNLILQKRQDEAWLLLAKTTRTGDKRFASRILSLGLETGKYDETLMLLDPEASDAPKWDNSDWITIALLLEKSGNTKHALELLRIHDKKKVHTRRIVAQLEQGLKSNGLPKSANLN